MNGSLSLLVFRTLALLLRVGSVYRESLSFVVSSIVGYQIPLRVVVQPCHPSSRTKRQNSTNLHIPSFSSVIPRVHTMPNSRRHHNLVRRSTSWLCTREKRHVRNQLHSNDTLQSCANPSMVRNCAAGCSRALSARIVEQSTTRRTRDRWLQVLETERP